MKKAVCVLTNNQPGISGYVEFEEVVGGSVEVRLNIKGLSPGLGFHIHQMVISEKVVVHFAHTLIHIILFMVIYQMISIV